MRRKYPTLSKECQYCFGTVIPVQGQNGPAIGMRFTLMEKYLTARQRHYLLSTLARFGWVHAQPSSPKEGASHDTAQGNALHHVQKVSGDLKEPHQTQKHCSDHPVETSRDKRHLRSRPPVVDARKGLGSAETSASAPLSLPCAA